jgi:2-methylaconitate cis-trans-isomerase PrpF
MIPDRYPAVFMRGGDASGLFFHLSDIPEHGAERDNLLLRAMGSPDSYGLQIDGLGKGTTSTSKCVIISKSTRDGCDIDYLFAQVLIDKPEVDWKRSCGNLAAATALFAVEEALLPRSKDGQYSFAMHQVNRGEVIWAKVDAIKKSVNLTFENRNSNRSPVIGPSPTLEVFLPQIGKIQLSIIDATNIFAFVESEAIESSTTGNENFSALKKRVDALQDLLAKEFSVDGIPLKARVLLIEKPKDFTDPGGKLIKADSADLFIRALSEHGFHHAIPMTAVMAASVGRLIPGTILAEINKSAINGDVIRIAHPSGIASAKPNVSVSEIGPRFVSADIELSARRIMSGEVFI